MTNQQRRVNKQARYSNIRWFNDRCAQALHEPTEKLVEAVGATLRTGGQQEFIGMSMNHAAELRLRQKRKDNKKLKRVAGNVINAHQSVVISSGNKENG